MSGIPVLKPKHSLVGRNYLPVLTKLRAATDPPVEWARLKKDHALEDYSKEELLENIEGLLGVPAPDVLACAGRDDNIQSARLALHYVILQCNLSGQPKGIPLVDVHTPPDITGMGGAGGSRDWEPPPKRTKAAVSATATITSEVGIRLGSADTI